MYRGKVFSLHHNLFRIKCYPLQNCMQLLSLTIIISLSSAHQDQEGKDESPTSGLPSTDFPSKAVELIFARWEQLKLDKYIFHYLLSHTI